MSIRLLVQRLDSELPIPAYAHEGDAGLDLRAAADTQLAPFERALVPTGIAVAIPRDTQGSCSPGADWR